MLKGFKEFISRGNVIDLAVAVVIGAAFSAIIKAVVDGFINPLIGVIFQVGSLSAWVWKVPTLSGGIAKFQIGGIVGAIITFLAVALVVYFFLVAPMNHLRERAAARAAAGQPDPDVPPTEAELLVEIRDLLAAQRDAR
ncbi:MAG TPA: large conductance mechanosensitive channel protein MscL [Microbacterium sp.]|nr:large conductance mechanosensitive channel protein MscL [Microbacterium sp.]